MLTAPDFESILGDVIAAISNQREVRLVRIEGFMNSGKTKLADLLIDRIDTKAIDIDNYLPKCRSYGKYTDNIDKISLFKDINEYIENKRSIIISGICSRIIFPKSSDIVELSIYTYQSSSYEGLILDQIDAHIEHFDERCARHQLHIDQNQYHRLYSPHRNCDAFLHIVGRVP